MRRRLALIALPAALSLITAACGSGNLPKLPGQAAGAKAETASAAMDMSMRVANIRYELADGVTVDSDKGKAYRFDKVTEADVKKAAKAFGVAGDIKEDEYGWAVGAAAQGKSVSKIEKTLYVGKEGSFSMSLAYPESSVAPDAAASSSAGGSDVTEPAPPTDAPKSRSSVSESEATKIAKDLLEKAGVDLGDAKTDATGDFGQVTVFFKPTFDGRTVDGYELAATVDGDKNVISANGLLHAPKSVGSYELASLKRAVERLNETNGNAFATTDMATDDVGAPEPAIGGPAVDVPSDTPSYEEPSSEPMVITLTKANIGLMLQSDSSNQTWLVPAYVFDTDQNGQVTAAAADDKYIEKPVTPTTGKVDTGAGDGSSGDPGTGATSPGSAPNCATNDPSDDQTLTVQVCASSTTVKAGETVGFKIDMGDSDRQFEEGCANGVTASYGDNAEGEARCLACQSEMPAGSGKTTRSLEHKYEKAGNYTAVFTIKSGLSCGPADPRDSVATVRIPVTVV